MQHQQGLTVLFIKRYNGIFRVKKKQIRKGSVSKTGCKR